MKTVILLHICELYKLPTPKLQPRLMQDDFCGAKLYMIIKKFFLNIIVLIKTSHRQFYDSVKSLLPLRDQSASFIFNLSLRNVHSISYEISHILLTLAIICSPGLWKIYRLHADEVDPL